MRVNARLCTLGRQTERQITTSVVSKSCQQLSFDINARKVVAGANSMLGLINRHFRHIETIPFMNPYTTLVRPKVEYCMTVAQPVYKKDKEKIERVQHRATKLLQEMENKAYSE